MKVKLYVDEKETKLESGYYWVLTSSGKRIIAKWFSSPYNWFTTMGTILEFNHEREKIVEVLGAVELPEPKKRKIFVRYPGQKIPKISKTTVKPEPKKRIKRVVVKKRIKRKRK